MSDFNYRIEFKRQATPNTETMLVSPEEIRSQIASLENHNLELKDISVVIPKEHWGHVGTLLTKSISRALSLLEE